MLRIINVDDTSHPVLVKPQDNQALRAENRTLRLQIDRLADENVALLKTVKSMRLRVPV